MGRHKSIDSLTRKYKNQITSSIVDLFNIFRNLRTNVNSAKDDRELFDNLLLPNQLYRDLNVAAERFRALVELELPSRAPTASELNIIRKEQIQQEINKIGTPND